MTEMRTEFEGRQDTPPKKYANGMLEVRVPAPRAATPRMIEVKAA